MRRVDNGAAISMERAEGHVSKGYQTMNENERLFIEAHRTGMVTITAGCETVTVDITGELYSLVRLLHLPNFENQTGMDFEFRAAYLDAIFEKEKIKE